MLRRRGALPSLFVFVLLWLSLAESSIAKPFAYMVGDLANSSPANITQVSSLFRVDLATGEAVFIGRVEDAASPGTFYTTIGGISIQPTTGTLFGVEDIGDSLITIDKDTAKATKIDVLNPSAPFPSISGFGLSFDASGTLYFAASSGRRLSVVDPVTADVSDIVIGGSAPNTRAIADASATHLWALRRLLGPDHDLISIEKVPPGDPLPPGFITSIGTLSPALSGASMIGLDQAPDGTLWGTQRQSSAAAELYQVDTTTAAVSGVTPITVPATGQVVVNARSLSIVDPVPFVPALAPYLLGLVAASLLALGARTLSRRR